MNQEQRSSSSLHLRTCSSKPFVFPSKAQVHCASEQSGTEQMVSDGLLNNAILVVLELFDLALYL